MKFALSALVVAAGLGFASTASAAPTPVGIGAAESMVDQVAMRRCKYGMVKKGRKMVCKAKPKMKPARRMM